MLTNEVVLERNGSSAIATLNRPRVLNVLNKNMLLILRSAFVKWDQPNNGVSCVVVQGAGEKSFCAGGDIVHLAKQDVAERLKVGRDFFRVEYRLDYQVAMMQKPFVALLDGYTMGGGCGLSMHGAFKVATERTVFAMPESFVGLFPDVGATRFLGILQPGLGKYLGITGARLKGNEVKVAGLATHYILSHRIPEVLQTLARLDAKKTDMTTVDGILRSFEDPQDYEEIESVQEKLAFMSSCFRHNNIDDIMFSLQKHKGEHLQLCKRALEDISRGSPLSIYITLEQFKRGKGLSLKDCLEMEFGMLGFFLRGKADFFEGVRAKLIDKDGEPDWKYKSIEEVPPSLVENCFNQIEDLGLAEDSLDILRQKLFLGAA